MEHLRREAAIAQSSRIDVALSRRRGLTLIEIAIGLSLVTIVLAMVAQAVGGLQRLGTDGEIQAQLASSGNRALRSVLSDLRQTGFVSDAGLDFPHLFTDGDAGPGFDVHDHAAAQTLVDYGPAGSREIVFRMPADADSDGVPDLDGNGALVWDAADFSYVLVTGADGVNTLQRRTDGAAPRTVARHVDRLIVDNSITSGFQIPVDALRVQIDMAIQDASGTVHTLSLQGIVRARNGGGV